VLGARSAPRISLSATTLYLGLSYGA